jgi:hypothetical protein
VLKLEIIPDDLDKKIEVPIDFESIYGSAPKRTAFKTPGRQARPPRPASAAYRTESKPIRDSSAVSVNSRASNASTLAAEQKRI